MKRRKKTRNNGHMIVGALLTGKPLKTKDISDIILKNEGKELKIQDIASMLSKMTDENRSHLGYFIQREKKGNAFVYQMAEEALGLSDKKAYDLTLRAKKGRYSLSEALEEFPELSRYIPADAEIKPAETVPRRKKPRQSVKALSSQRERAKTKPENQISENVQLPEISVSERLEDKDMERLAISLIQKIAELGGLNVNLRISVKFEGFE